MKKMFVLMLMVMMSVVAAKAQIVVADNYAYVYVSYNFGLTSVAIPRSMLPYGKDFKKGDIVPMKIVRMAKAQAQDTYRRTGSVVRTAEEMSGQVVTGVQVVGQIYGQAKATRDAVREAKTVRRTYSAPATTTTTTTRRSTVDNVPVNQNVTYNVSKQRFENIEDLVGDY
jgi:hypothetical protein